MSSQVLFDGLADLGEHLLRITDNGGATADRYTVYFADGSCLAMSENPSSPGGISEWLEGVSPEVAHDAVESGQEVDLAVGDLPPGIAMHVLARLNAVYAGWVERIENSAVGAKQRESALENEGTADCFATGIYKTGDGYFIRRSGEDSDLGPYGSARQVLLASLPGRHTYCGPEYFSTVGDVNRLAPSDEVAAAVERLKNIVMIDMARSMFNRG